MNDRRRLTRLACLLALLLVAPSQSFADLRGIVFDGKGRTTDRVEIVDLSFKDVLYPINLQNNWGLMNQRGQIVVYPRFEWTDYSFEGISRVVVNGKTGYVRGTVRDDADPDTFFIPPQFDYADRFSNGVAVVQKKEKWGMIDKSGKLLVPMRYQGILRMQDGFAVVQQADRCGYVNRAGKLKIPFQFKQARSFHNGFAAVQLANNRWGFIDKRGKVVWQESQGMIRQLGDMHEQYARVQVQTANGDRWGYLSKAFRLSIKTIYEDARDFHNGLAAVKLGGKWGFIDQRGKWVIKPQFEEVDDFDDAEGSNDFEDLPRGDPDREEEGPSTGGLYAMVKVKGKWGYINRVFNGGLLPQFDEAQPFFRGLARVDRDGSFAYITETGKVVFDPRVALSQGLIDTRVIDVVEDGRLRDNGRINADSVSSPEPAIQADVPYVAEHEYVEMLPSE